MASTPEKRRMWVLPSPNSGIDKKDRYSIGIGYNFGIGPIIYFASIDFTELAGFSISTSAISSRLLSFSTESGFTPLLLKNIYKSAICDGFSNVSVSSEAYMNGVLDLDSDSEHVLSPEVVIQKMIEFSDVSGYQSSYERFIEKAVSFGADSSFLTSFNFLLNFSMDFSSESLHNLSTGSIFNSVLLFEGYTRFGYKDTHKIMKLIFKTKIFKSESVNGFGNAPAVYDSKNKQSVFISKKKTDSAL